MSRLKEAHDIIENAKGKGTLFSATPVDVGDGPFLMASREEHDGMMIIQSLGLAGPHPEAAQDEMVRVETDITVNILPDFPEQTLVISTVRKDGQRILFEYRENPEVPEGAATLFFYPKNEPMVLFFIDNKPDGEFFRFGVQDWPDKSVFKRSYHEIAGNWDLTMERVHAVLTEMFKVAPDTLNKVEDYRLIDATVAPPHPRINAA